MYIDIIYIIKTYRCGKKIVFFLQKTLNLIQN